MKREKKNQDLASVIDDIGNTLQFMADAGCRGFACDAFHHEMVCSWGRHGLERPESLHDIRSDLKDCRRCGLSIKRTQVVFGDGCEQARLVFVGEGPGYEEDKQGKPFVGAAGQAFKPDFGRDASFPGRYLYLQYRQMPPAKQSQSTTG